MAWTVTFNGTIEQGFDNSGVFGVAGTNLRGLSFSQTVSIDTAPPAWTVQNGSPIHQDISGYGPRFTDTVTVNGHSVTFQVAATSYGRQFLFDEFSTRHTGADYLYSDQRGMTGPGNGDTLRAFQYANSYNTGFVPGLDFNQSISHAGSGLTTWSEFVITGQNHANFFGNANSVAVNAVPEPETYAMMVVGLLGLGWAVRRKAKAA